MRNIFLCLLILMGIGLQGCGGGGESNGGGSVTTVTVQVPAGNPVDISGLPKIGLTVQSNAPITLTATEYSQAVDKPPATAMPPTGSMARIEISQVLDGSITISFPMPNGSFAPIAKIGSDWVDLPDGETRNGRYYVTITDQNGRAVSTRSLGTNFLVVLGKLSSNYGKSPSWAHLKGSGTTGRQAVIVHGWADSIRGFQPLADALYGQLPYQAVNGFDYDPSQPIEGNAVALANFLAPYDQKQTDIIAHSEGGLVARRALEILGATKSVNLLATVCTPNEGSRFDSNDYAFMRFLRQYLLNNAFGYGWVVIDSEALREMQPGSSFLQSLNSVGGQTGLTNYLMIGTTSDIAVNPDSARAVHTSIESLTGGAVERQTLPGTHSYLVKDSVGINQLVELLREVSQTPPSITLALEPSSVEASLNRWPLTLRLNNDSNQYVTVVDIALMLHDAEGNWRGRWWFKPDTPQGQFFPVERYQWDHPFSAGETYVSPVNVYADDNRTEISQVEPRLQRQTAVAWVHLKDVNGHVWTVTATSRCLYQGIGPAPARTRQAEGGPTDTRLFGPG